MPSRINLEEDIAMNIERINSGGNTNEAAAAQRPSTRDLLGPSNVKYFTAPENPFSSERIEVLPPQHTYGAASMQVYANGQVAYYTHASADGFLAYVKSVRTNIVPC